MKKSVHEMAEKIYPAVTFTDHSGVTRRFRRYLWMNKIGITDVKAKDVIVQAKHEKIIISELFEVFIVGGYQVGWEILSLTGENLYPNMRFDTIDEACQELEKRVDF